MMHQTAYLVLYSIIRLGCVLFGRDDVAYVIYLMVN